jgi:hypothetical protein
MQADSKPGRKEAETRLLGGFRLSKAEGEGFEPSSDLTARNGFRDPSLRHVKGSTEAASGAGSTHARRFARRCHGERQADRRCLPHRFMLSGRPTIGKLAARAALGEALGRRKLN